MHSILLKIFSQFENSMNICFGQTFLLLDELVEAATHDYKISIQQDKPTITKQLLETAQF